MTTPAAPLVAAPPRRRKRSDALAARIRDLIVQHGLAPGDRIPQAWLADAEMKAARGTLREAMKALETQGLVISRTGPGGGAFVAAPSGEQAIDFLSSLFLFNRPRLDEIRALRRLLEPELAASLAGRLGPPQLAALQAAIRLHDDEPATDEATRRQDLTPLEFHALLASFAENRLLGFVCAFLQRLERDLADRRPGATAPDPAWREAELGHQIRLIRLLKTGGPAEAHKLVADHLSG